MKHLYYYVTGQEALCNNILRPLLLQNENSPNYQWQSHHKPLQASASSSTI